MKPFDYIKKSLSRLYSPQETEKLAVLILQHATGFSRAKVLSNKDIVLSENEHKKINLIVERLKKSEPIEYILGETEFFGLIFELNENTLIPRPETEELVDWIIQDSKFDSNLHILDIGTGSGCIAISLAKNLAGSKVMAFDISEEALKVAQKNADENGVKVDFRRCDILNLTGFKNLLGFDVIVSNPPYVLESEKADIQKNVLNFEPHQALFVPNENPLLFYNAIADFALKYLKKDGNLYFEINRMFAKETAKMLDEKGFFDIKIRKDLCGNDRMVKATKK